jgi:predicted permease
LEGFGLYGWGWRNVSVDDGRPERRIGAYVTAGLLDAVGVQPILGRTFRPEEEGVGRGGVIILGYELWHNLFDAAPSVIGETVYLDRRPTTVIGVMPEGYMFPSAQAFWTPMTVDPLAADEEGDPVRWLAAGRLLDGVSRGHAEAQLSGIATQLRSQFPSDYQGLGVVVRTLKQRIVPTIAYRVVYAMLAAAFGVLLLGCANVTNLLLARSSARTHEVALRGALGASRLRLGRQLLTEVAVLAIIGGGIGLWLGLVGLDWFQATLDYVEAAGAAKADETPSWFTFERDVRVYAFVLGATVLSCVFAGVLPALRTSATGAAEAMKGAAKGSKRLTQGRFTAGLVVTEVAVSCVLLIMAGLMARSVTRLDTHPFPWETENVFTARFALRGERYPSSNARRAFYERLLPEVEAIPGAVAVALSDGLPGFGHSSTSFIAGDRVYAEGESLPEARLGHVTAGYFDALGVRAVRGRLFDDSDIRDSPLVAIVNESFARVHLQGDPIGQRVRRVRRDGDAAPWRTVVGVVPDLSMEGFGSGRHPAGLYVPLAQWEWFPNLTYVTVRASGPSLATLTNIRSAVGSLDRHLPLDMVAPMDGIMLRFTWFYQVFGRLALLFGAAALFLGAMGLYGLMSFAVSQRTHEMGVRLALGAGRRGLVGMVMKRGLAQLALGLGIGLGLARLASGQLVPFVYEVDPSDPSVFGVVLATLLTTALMAIIIPARRVTKLNAVVALGGE